MKILYANLMFQLPDDFMGTYRDALRLYADYDEELTKANGGKSPNYAESDGATPTAEEDKILNAAMNVMQELHRRAMKCGRRAANSCCLAEYSEEENDWTYLDYDGNPIKGVSK